MGSDAPFDEPPIILWLAPPFARRTDDEEEITPTDPMPGRHGDVDELPERLVFGPRPVERRGIAFKVRLTTEEFFDLAREAGMHEDVGDVIRRRLGLRPLVRA